MNRLLMTAAVAAVGLTTFAVTPASAAGRPGSGGLHNGSGYRSERGNHSFHPSHRFDYGKHGFRSFSWTHYRWSDYYHTYCYWAPSYGWCFYEPSYSYYLPISYYTEVYPEEVPTGPAPVFAPPTTIQQTTVIVESPTTAPLPVPTPVTPAPTAVQQTKVVVPTMPPSDGPAPPLAPAVAPAPTAVQQTKVVGG